MPVGDVLVLAPEHGSVGFAERLRNILNCLFVNGMLLGHEAIVNETRWRCQGQHTTLPQAQLMRPLRARSDHAPGPKSAGGRRGGSGGWGSGCPGWGWWWNALAVTEPHGRTQPLIGFDGNGWDGTGSLAARQVRRMASGERRHSMAASPTAASRTMQGRAAPP